MGVEGSKKMVMMFLVGLMFWAYVLEAAATDAFYCVQKCLDQCSGPNTPPSCFSDCMRQCQGSFRYFFAKWRSVISIQDLKL